MRSLNGAR